MNWMIDGAYGDYYRTAMGYPRLQAHDEWEIERHAGKSTNLRQRLLASTRKLRTTGRNALQSAGARVSARERTVS